MGATTRSTVIMRGRGDPPPRRRGGSRRRALLHAMAALTPPGMAAGAAGFGASWVSAATWCIRFSPGHYDGRAAVGDLEYGEDCRCFDCTSGFVRASAA